MRARGWPITTAGLVLAAVASAGVASLAEDRVSGLITRTYVIVENTELSGDVTCDVTGAACFSFGAPGVELRLNGYSITGKADPVSACGGGAATAGEFGIVTGGQAKVSIQGPGLVQRFRSHGVNVLASTGARVQGITAATNCLSGIFVAGTSFDTVIEGNVSVRNGSSAPGSPCGGI
jgi:hypothetical protein